MRGSVHDRPIVLSRFLLGYSRTNHATTGRAPCELLMSRQLFTLFNLMQPSLQADVDKPQDQVMLKVVNQSVVSSMLVIR